MAALRRHYGVHGDFGADNQAIPEVVDRLAVDCERDLSRIADAKLFEDSLAQNSRRLEEQLREFSAELGQAWQDGLARLREQESAARAAALIEGFSLQASRPVSLAHGGFVAAWGRVRAAYEAFQSALPTPLDDVVGLKDDLTAAQIQGLSNQDTALSVPRYVAEVLEPDFSRRLTAMEPLGIRLSLAPEIGAMNKSALTQHVRGLLEELQQQVEAFPELTPSRMPQSDSQPETPERGPATEQGASPPEAVRQPSSPAGASARLAALETVRPASAPEPMNLFRRSGSNWNIRYEGGPQFALPHRIGLTYIQEILAHPGQERTASVLAELGRQGRIDRDTRTRRGAKQATDWPASLEMLQKF